MPEIIQTTLIEEEMKESYIDYAMSVITSRALPDVNDGLKPVHRKILYALYKSKLFHSRPFRKSAFIIGRVLASYHPHGDLAVYDSMVRMAQGFSLRYPLIEGQGNFGCFTGDTKIKLLDGTSKSFKELSKSHKNKSFYVYSIDKNSEIVIGEASNPRLTKKKTEIVELTLDTEKKIRCTPDHRFLLKNLKYKQAKDLTLKDSLMPGNLKLSKIKDSRDYLMIKDTKSNKYKFVHAISLRKKLKSEEYKSTVMKNKILNYVNNLVTKHGEKKICEDVYNDHRIYNCYPKFEDALKYFPTYDEMINQAKNYNHKIINIKFLKRTEDVYDITVKDHHNFLLDCGVFVHNSVDGHPAAASRYTEARLSKIAYELLEDLDKKTVKYVPNYDNSTKEPVVLPGRLPNLLLNGTTGIAVGMASNIPPHNINEVIDAITATIENPELSTEEIMQYLKGPDFPTGGIIQGRSGIENAYTKGRGKITLKAKVEIQDKKLIITEIPYMVNKTTLIETIADLVRDKRVEGIRNIQDESDRKGMSIVIELRDNANPEIILNKLYKYSPLQTTIGVMMIALVAGQPKIMTLKDIIDNYISHRRRVVTRRTGYELKKAQERANILEGLQIALKNIDQVVKTIKASKDVKVAKTGLISGFKLSEKQAVAILEMRLQRLTSLETKKIDDEHQELLKKIREYQEILASEQRIYQIIKDELKGLKERYGDERRTEIQEQELDTFDDKDFIKEEDVTVTFTRSGYIKQTPLTEYKSQKRGGTGIKAAKIKEEDVIQQVFTTSNYNTLLFFTNLGRVYWLQTYQLPKGGRYVKGKAIVNILKLKDQETVQAILPLKKLNKNDYILLATKHGLLKKTSIEAFSRPRLGGIYAIKLKDKDELVSARLTPGNLDFFLATKKGYAIRFNERDVRSMGRTASGVRGIRLQNDEVIGMEVAKPSATILTVTSNGYGKRSKIDDYRLIKRGGKGVINILTKYLKPGSKNENVVGIKTVLDHDEILFITKKGSIIRTKASGISIIGRTTRGVRLIRLKDNDKVVDVARIVANNHEAKQKSTEEGST